MWNPFRKFKIKKFKRIKLRKERTKEKRLYRIHFSFLLRDKNKNHEIENLEIFIPAKSAFDAKNNLVEFLQRKVGYNLHNIEVFEDEEETDIDDETKS